MLSMCYNFSDQIVHPLESVAYFQCNGEFQSLVGLVTIPLGVP